MDYVNLGYEYIVEEVFEMTNNEVLDKIRQDMLMRNFSK